MKALKFNSNLPNSLNKNNYNDKVLLLSKREKREEKERKK
jgi:hypothetical protein